MVLEELADDAALDGGAEGEGAAAVRAAGFNVPLGRGGFDGSSAHAGDPCEAVDVNFLRRSAWGSWFTCGDGGDEGGAELHHWAAVAQELGTAVISSVEDLNVDPDLELDE